jgi:transcriptional regulator GlxA family with amidase domain
MIRIDSARSALDAGRSVGDSAHLAGFGSAETLRRVFVREFGISPKAYRDRFKSTG